MEHNLKKMIKILFFLVLLVEPISAIAASHFNRYDVTVEEYCVFLNAVATTDTYGLYDETICSNTGVTQQFEAEVEFQKKSNIVSIERSGSPGYYYYEPIQGCEKLPITCISWFNQARFCNWLENGQPRGLQEKDTTEEGSYTLHGKMSFEEVSEDMLRVNEGSTWHIASEDECCKTSSWMSTDNPLLEYQRHDIGFGVVVSQSAIAKNTVAIHRGNESSPQLHLTSPPSPTANDSIPSSRFSRWKEVAVGLFTLGALVAGLFFLFPEFFFRRGYIFRRRYSIPTNDSRDSIDPNEAFIERLWRSNNRVSLESVESRPSIVGDQRISLGSPSSNSFGSPPFNEYESFPSIVPNTGRKKSIIKRFSDGWRRLSGGVS
ncbi:MAG: hypothetical protein A3F67_01680 [Verrucomicrobia bacterium RIFCSPHIGHO2_12_FULL_41_10]|nr:MAG: hypothetical protein A3F67_01680 [Verrucomicrobia bacterium RIFCSPHIGHO2_12_FULL_41_10]